MVPLKGKRIYIISQYSTGISVGPDLACHPVKNITKSSIELRNKPETIIEFYVLLFRFIMAFTRDLEVLALKHPQKYVGYKSRTCFITFKCMLTRSIPQSKRCTFHTKHAHFIQNKLVLYEIIIKGYTSLSIRYNDSLTLSVPDITSCIQLEDRCCA